MDFDIVSQILSSLLMLLLRWRIINCCDYKLQIVCRQLLSPCHLLIYFFWKWLHHMYWNFFLQVAEMARSFKKLYSYFCKLCAFTQTIPPCYWWNLFNNLLRKLKNFSLVWKLTKSQRTLFSFKSGFYIRLFSKSAI